MLRGDVMICGWRMNAKWAQLDVFRGLTASRPLFRGRMLVTPTPTYEHSYSTVSRRAAI